MLDCPESSQCGPGEFRPASQSHIRLKPLGAIGSRYQPHRTEYRTHPDDPVNQAVRQIPTSETGAYMRAPTPTRQNHTTRAELSSECAGSSAWFSVLKFAAALG